MNNQKNQKVSYVRKQNSLASSATNQFNNQCSTLSQLKTCLFYKNGNCKFGINCRNSHKHFFKVLDHKFKNQSQSHLKQQQTQSQVADSQLEIQEPKFNLIVAYNTEVNHKLFNQLLDNFQGLQNNGQLEIWIQSQNELQTQQLNLLSNNIKDLNLEKVYEQVNVQHFYPKSDDSNQQAILNSSKQEKATQEANSNILLEVRKIQNSLSNFDIERKNQIQKFESFNQFRASQQIKNSYIENNLEKIQNQLAQLAQDLKKISLSNSKPPIYQTKNQTHEQQKVTETKNSKLANEHQTQKQILTTEPVESQKQKMIDISQEIICNQIFQCGCGSSKKGYSSFASLRTHFYQAHNGTAPKNSSHDINGTSTFDNSIKMGKIDQSNLDLTQNSDEGTSAIKGLKARFHQDASKKKRQSSLSKSRQNTFQKNQEDLIAKEKQNSTKISSRGNHFRKISDSDQFQKSTNFQKMITDYEFEQSKVTVYGADEQEGGGVWYSKSEQSLDDQFLGSEEQPQCI